MVRYFCEGCLSHYPTNLGDCPDCDEEPLLDLRDRAVVEMLLKFDEQAWRERVGKVTAVCAILCSPLLLSGLAVGALALPIFGVATLGLSSVVYPSFAVTPRTPLHLR